MPLEQLKREVRQSQKLVERETAQVKTAIDQLLQQQQEPNNQFDQKEVSQTINSLVERLRTLKRKLEDSKQEEAGLIQKSKHRALDLSELNKFTSTSQPEFQRWCRNRLDRVLVDYMLRNGNLETAQHVMDSHNLGHFADTSLFTLVMSLEQELREEHSCQSTLQWCVDNRSSLRKIQSPLEFELRLQEFIEMFRAGNSKDAIAYSKKYLMPWSDTQLPRIQRAMGLLAFNPTTKCSPYRAMFDEARWDTLAMEFRNVIFQIYNLPSQPLLHLLLQTGLSALKTPTCLVHNNSDNDKSDCMEQNRNCPVCQTDTLGKLATDLPLSHHVNSNLVCVITGRKMNEDNPPMRLPNGYVYSYQSLKDMASRLKGKVKCPRSGNTFKLAEAKKMFIS